MLKLSLILPSWWMIAVMPALRSDVELLLILPLWWMITVMPHRCGGLRSIEWPGRSACDSRHEDSEPAETNLSQWCALPYSCSVVRVCSPERVGSSFGLNPSITLALSCFF